MTLIHLSINFGFKNHKMQLRQNLNNIDLGNNSILILLEGEAQQMNSPVKIEI